MPAFIALFPFHRPQDGRAFGRRQPGCRAQLAGQQHIAAACRAGGKIPCHQGGEPAPARCRYPEALVCTEAEMPAAKAALDGAAQHVADRLPADQARRLQQGLDGGGARQARRQKLRQYESRAELMDGKGFRMDGCPCAANPSLLACRSDYLGCLSLLMRLVTLLVPQAWGFISGVNEPAPGPPAAPACRRRDRADAAARRDAVTRPNLWRSMPYPLPVARYRCATTAGHGR